VGACVLLRHEAIAYRRTLP